MEKKKVASKRRTIKKIENKRYLNTSFNKRRNRLFRKTRDLCTDCGADAAVIVLSKCGRPYAFGSPSVDAIIDRYLNESSLQHVDGDLDGNNAGFSESQQSMEGVQETRDRFWWKKSIEGLDIRQLKQCRAALLELKKNVVNQLEERRTREFFPTDSTINK